MMGSPNDPRSLHEAPEIEEFLDPRTTPERRAVLARAILASESLSEALYSDESLRQALEDVAETRANGNVLSIHRPRTRWVRIALPIAAGLLMAVLSPRIVDLLLGGSEDDELGTSRRFRSASVAPHGISPSGEIQQGSVSFVWSSALGATSYRLEILGETENVLFSIDTPETTFLLADAAISFDAAAATKWRVVAKLMNGSAPVSEPVPLRFIEGN